MQGQGISSPNRLTWRKFLSVLLAVAMLVSLFPVAAYAAFPDVQGHWGQRAIEKWSDMGILKGSEGAFRPDDPITRGEMAVVIDCVMKYRTRSANHFSDLGQAFYTDAILKANAAGVIKGDGATMRPTDEITREEAAVMLGSALGLGEDPAGGTAFSDYASISPWAVGGVNALANKGYVKGFNGVFQPQSSITRAEVVTLLDSSIEQLYSENREYTGDVPGTAIVNTPGVVLKDMKISGDLIIAQGVGEGDVTLDNVTVLGNTLVRGGGADSILIQGGSQIARLIIEKADDGALRIVTAEGALVEAVLVDDGTDGIILTGSFESITVAADVAVKAVGARIGQVDVTAGDAVLDVDKDSVVDRLNVAETAADTKITVSGRVETLTANARMAVNNSGTITRGQINANGVTIDGNPPSTLNVADAVTFKPAGGSAPSPGRRSGGSGGGSSDSAPFAGGSGTAADPYRVATAAQLDRVRDYLDKHFILTADIDLSGYANWDPIGVFQPLSEAPEDAENPDPRAAFSGTLDGNGHTIANIKIDRPASFAVGLFGCAVGGQGNSSSIHDLTVENVDVTGFYLAGGVVGLQYAGCLVENVTLTGSNTVQGLQGVGGIVGTSFDTVEGCSAVADITVLGDDGACAGVVVGGTDGGSLIDCRANGGSVTAAGNGCWALGGVCGAPYAAPEITNCHAENVTITASGANNRLVGGLVGFTGAYGQDDPTAVTDCTVTGAVITVSGSTTRVGGLVGGSTEGSTQTVPSVFAVNGCSTGGAITGGTESVGSIAGYAYHSTVVNCTSTMTINGDSNAPQVGLSESPFAGGSGTAADPYRIETAAQLDQLRHHLDKNFILTADIDLAGYENWEPIGIFQPASSHPEDAENPDSRMAFSGTLDGNGHTIANIKINRPASFAMGLFGCAVGGQGSPCSIHDLTVENVDVTGFYLAGGVVGLQYAGCLVEDVTLVGSNTVRGLQGVGGIVGTSFDTVEGCSAVADITVLGDDGACAGVVVGGTDGGSLIDCRATGGSVTAAGNGCWALGGVCGAPYAAPEITNCHAENVTITASGANNRLVGGLVGFTGTYGQDDPTAVIDCTVTGAAITVSGSTTRVGGLVGGSTEGSTQTVPSVFAVNGCSTGGAITGGTESVGSIAGYAYHSTVANCTGAMTWDGGSLEQIGLADTD